MNLKEQVDKSRLEFFTKKNLIESASYAISLFSKTIDNLLINDFNNRLKDTELTNGICVIGLGGYGRGELCPYSDIDLLILHKENAPKEIIEKFVRSIWDTGLHVGSVVRSLKDCKNILGEDIITDTAFLDYSFLIGDSYLSKKLSSKILLPYFTKKKNFFIEEMLKILRSGIYSSVNSLYRIEPDLKNGICTLRDCQRIIWINKIANGFVGRCNNKISFFDNESNKKFFESYEFLLKIRSTLHIIHKRRLDILETSSQDDVANILGFVNPGMLMEEYFKTVSVVKQLVLTVLEKNPQKKSVFKIIRKKLSYVKLENGLMLVDGILFLHRSFKIPNDSVIWMLEVFKTASACHASFSMKLSNTIKEYVLKSSPKDYNNSKVDYLFKDIISSCENVGRIFQMMHETNFLEGVIPEFKALKCKVEYDTYHEFTVDQHILLTLKSIDEIDAEKDPVIFDAWKNIHNRFVFRLSLLLHDIGKSISGNHCRTGAIISEKICARLGLSDEDTNRVTFLIKNHLKMSELSFHRELEPLVLEEFVHLVGDEENLNMLFILTVLDIKNVGSRTWTGWKATQLKELYLQTKKSINRISKYKLKKIKLPVLDIMDDELLLESEIFINSKDRLNIKIEKLLNFYRLTVWAYDRSDFLSDFVGCLASEGIGILSAKVRTLSNGLAVDTFDIVPDKRVVIPLEEKIDNVKSKLKLIEDNKKTIEDILSDRLKYYPVKSIRELHSDIKITISNKTSNNYTVIEIDSFDRFGLLHTILKTMTKLELNIVFARIGIHIDHAMDVFYVLEKNGKKINIVRFEEIKETLLKSVNKLR